MDDACTARMNNNVSCEDTKLMLLVWIDNEGKCEKIALES